MEAVSEAENVTLFMSQFGRFILQNAHIKILKGNGNGNSARTHQRLCLLRHHSYILQAEAVSKAQIVTKSSRR